MDESNWLKFLDANSGERKLKVFHVRCSFEELSGRSLLGSNLWSGRPLQFYLPHSVNEQYHLIYVKVD